MGGDADGRARFCVQSAKLVLRIFGALVSASFAVMTCRTWLEPEVENFWEFCHFIGQTLLGAFVGLGGCYAEIKGSMSSVTTHFRKFAMNRIGLSIFYFWLGCYVMGGEIVGDGVWRTISHTTGIVAWAVAAGDLFVSCCAERMDEEEEVLSPSRKEVSTSHPVTLGREGAPASAKAASFQASGFQASAPAGQTSAPPPSNVAVGDNPFQSNAKELGLERPEGGWNTGGSKAFDEPEGGWATGGGSNTFGAV